MRKIVVLRMGHRYFRDSRVTTHVCLTSRALGAEKAIIADRHDKAVEATVRDLSQKFGGKFEVDSGIPWRQVIKDWKGNGGLVVHLTAYGLQLPKVIGEIRGSPNGILVIVGSEKMPGEVFKLADWNVSVTSQPMSEVGALAIFLDWVNGHEAFDLEFPDAEVEIVPSKSEKTVRKLR